MPKGKNSKAYSIKHAGTVQKLLRLIDEIISDIETYKNNGHHWAEDEQEKWKYIFGDKENIVSALTKLTGILVKIIPIENEIMAAKDKNNEKKADISQEDIAIIKRYLDKIKDEEPQMVVDITPFLESARNRAKI